jgi:hypothetical protein
MGIAGVTLVYWPELDHAKHRGSVALGALFTAGAVLVTTLGNLVAHRNHERKLHGWATMAWSMGYGALASWSPRSRSASRSLSTGRRPTCFRSRICRVRLDPRVRRLSRAARADRRDARFLRRRDGADRRAGDLVAVRGTSTGRR